jgi:hypothetical protein
MLKSARAPTRVVRRGRRAATDTGSAAAKVLEEAETLSRQSAELSREVNSFVQDVRAA